MSATTEPTQDETKLTPEFLEHARRLTADDKDALVGLLLSDLDGPEDDPEAIRTAWKDEIARRIQEYVSGQVPAHTAAESAELVRDRLREKFPDAG